MSASSPHGFQQHYTQDFNIAPSHLSPAQVQHAMLRTYFEGQQTLKAELEALRRENTDLRLRLRRMSVRKPAHARGYFSSHPRTAPPLILTAHLFLPPFVFTEQDPSAESATQLFLRQPGGSAGSRSHAPLPPLTDEQRSELMQELQKKYACSIMGVVGVRLRGCSSGTRKGQDTGLPHSHRRTKP